MNACVLVGLFGNADVSKCYLSLAGIKTILAFRLSPVQVECQVTFFGALVLHFLAGRNAIRDAFNFGLLLGKDSLLNIKRPKIDPFYDYKPVAVNKFTGQ